MDDAHRLRSFDILASDVLVKRVHIVGAGAVGSFTALTLAKMGFSDITVYDFDDVEPENVGCQLYGPWHRGVAKVEALFDIVKSLTGTEIKALKTKLEEPPADADIFVTAVDNMEVRTQLFVTGQEMGFSPELYIDPRMGAEIATIFTVRRGQDVKGYRKTLISDDDAVNEPCTAKATAYCALLLSGMIARVIKGFLMKEPYPKTLQWSIRDDAFEVYRGKV